MSQSLNESRDAYNNGYYKEKLEQGLQFQDFVTQRMYLNGWVMVGYSSRLFQIKYGENIMGAEIKNDQNFRKTGNLYIEIAEKSHPDNDEFVASGIYREDNSVFFIIGDTQTFWIFSTKLLRLLAECGRYRSVQIPTSKGFLLPLADSDKYSISRITYDKPSNCSLWQNMPKP
jgi:hypothetical protein